MLHKPVNDCNRTAQAVHECGNAPAKLRVACLQRLLWLPRMVLVCALVGAGATSESKPTNLPCHLLLYPRHHLDHSSLLTRHALPQVSADLLTLLAAALPAFSFTAKHACCVLCSYCFPIPFSATYSGGTDNPDSGFIQSVLHFAGPALSPACAASALHGCALQCFRGSRCV